SNAPDNNNNGRISGPGVNFGTNGLANLLETSADSGQINYTITDTNNDNTPDYLSLDSDSDNCFDVVEAGFTDGNNNGLLGNLDTPEVDSNGRVINISVGYTNPNTDFQISAPISITQQPSSVVACETAQAVFSIQTGIISTIQWQQSDDGISWQNISDSAENLGANTTTLSLNNLMVTQNGIFIRAQLNRIGNACDVFSEVVTLTVEPQPALNTDVALVQCDDNIDGITDFNLLQTTTNLSDNA
ncbi:hypothetical protein RZS08_25160, partial [Arthrospira platensis SPKY1]|nr:hypothetical protein [Arthrospira platensis SPKY1]